MSGWDLEHIIRTDLQLGSVIHAHVHASAEHQAQMAKGAGRGSDDRLDIHRPAPAGLNRPSTDGLLADLDAPLEDLVSAEDIIGRADALEPRVRHGLSAVFRGPARLDVAAAQEDDRLGHRRDLVHSHLRWRIQRPSRARTLGALRRDRQAATCGARASRSPSPIASTSTVSSWPGSRRARRPELSPGSRLARPCLIRPGQGARQSHSAHMSVTT